MCASHPSGIGRHVSYGVGRRLDLSGCMIPGLCPLTTRVATNGTDEPVLGYPPELVMARPLISTDLDSR